MFIFFIFFNFHLLIEIVDAYPTIKENIILGNVKHIFIHLKEKKALEKLVIQRDFS